MNIKGLKKKNNIINKMYPAVNLNQLYSLHLYDGLEIIFEDLNMLDSNVLKEVNNLDIIQIVPNIIINMNKKLITIIGYKINDSTYMVNRDGRGDVVTFVYQCSNEDIITGIGYLYQMYKNLVIKNEDKFDNKWNPKPYKPDE